MHQHMNNARYFTFMEQARVGYLREIGMTPSSKRESIPFILAHASCDFRIPAEIDEEIVTHMGVTKFGRTSFTMRYIMERGHDSVIIAEGETVLVCFDYSQMQKTSVPTFMIEAVNGLKMKCGLPTL